MQPFPPRIKATSPSLKLCQRAVLLTLVIVGLSGVSIRRAQATYVVTLQQVGPNVVATGAGTFDTFGLTPLDPGGTFARINASSGLLITGEVASLNRYFGFTGPGNFGAGTAADGSGSGDLVAIAAGASILGLPLGYLSGSPLSSSATFAGSFSSLGITPGTYVWTWGTGLHQDSFTLQAGAAVPDSGSTVALLSLSVAALFGVKRFRLHRFQSMGCSAR